MRDTHKRNVRLATAAVLTAAALILAYLEAVLGFLIPIPGVKLGLANLATLLLLYTYGVRYATVVSLLRIGMAALLFGSLFSLLYSLAGGVLALFAMILLWRLGFSPIASSTLGGMLHVVGQIGVACLVTETPRLVYYLPILLAAGFITGLALGALAKKLIPRMPK
jgi:heptaprenyl diphosphate synthase